MALAAIVSLSRGGVLSLAGELVFIAVVSARRDDEGGPRTAEGESKLVSFSFVPRPAAFIPFIAIAIAAGVHLSLSKTGEHDPHYGQANACTTRRAETDRMLKQTLYQELMAGRIAELPETFTEGKTNAWFPKTDSTRW